MKRARAPQKPANQIQAPTPHSDPDSPSEAPADGKKRRRRRRATGSIHRTGRSDS